MISLRFKVPVRLFIFSVSEAMGSQNYPEMYDANYSFRTPNGEITVRVTSDGKGKVREEKSSGPLQSVTITDYEAKVVYTISEATRLIKRAALKRPYESSFSSDRAKQKGADDLGTKTIDGLICQGWHYKENGSETEIWLDSAAGFIVTSKSKIQNMEIEMVLKNVNKTEPRTELFSIPNYPIVEE